MVVTAAGVAAAREKENWRGKLCQLKSKLAPRTGAFSLENRFALSQHRMNIQFFGANAAAEERKKQSQSIHKQVRAERPMWRT